MQLNDRELVAALTSILLPLVISLVLQPTWSDRLRALVAFLCIFIWTVLGVIYVGEGVPMRVDYHAWIRLLLVNALTAYTMYQNLYKPTGLAQRWEAKTSPPSEARERLIDDAERKAQPPMDTD